MAKSTGTYCRRIFLDRSDSSVTSSCAAFHGLAAYGSGESAPPDAATFFEVASCSKKLHLHKGTHESMQCFTNRLRILAQEALNFADFLEKGE